MHIRNATTADIPLIRELTMQVWPQTYLPIVGEVQVQYMLDQFYNPAALQKQMEEQGHQFVTGYDAGVPVAFASYNETASTIYKLQKLYIINGQQGKGTGKALVQHIVNAVRALGATELRLNVNRYNTSAMAFYERMGFTRLAEEDIAIGNGYFMNDYVLQMALK